MPRHVNCMSFSSPRLFLLAALVFFGGLALLPSEVFAGNCVTFCRNMTPRADRSIYVNYVVGNACSSASECRVGPPCVGDTSNASQDLVRDFCTNGLAMLSGEELRNASWCRDYLNEDRARTYFDGGRCMVTPVGAQPTAPDTRPRVEPTPVPAPARPGDTFRCRFLCVGDTQARDGGSCSAATDQTTCVSECRRTCQTASSAAGQRCAGLQEGGLVSGVLTDMEQAPQCIPAQPPSASVGGITDSQRFETVNESFANVSIPIFIGNAIKALLGIIGALFFAMLVWGGLQWMTAGGDQTQVKAAQTTTKNAMLGVAIIVMSYTLIMAFLQVVANFAGIGS